MNAVVANLSDYVRPAHPHMHPDEMERRDKREAAIEQAVQDYITDWCDGDLYDDGHTYSAPAQRLIEDYPEALGELLRAHRSGDPAELEHVAGRIGRAMDLIVRQQAETE